MVNYACGFNQSETGKYFKWIITNIIVILKPLTWALEEEKKIMGLSNHQWPEEEDEGSVRQQQIHGMGNKLKYEGTCKNHMICAGGSIQWKLYL